MTASPDRSRVAVLLATYNGAAYLREFLDSLLAQSESAFTLFVRDDGSTDGSIQIIKEYSGSLSIVLIESSERLGPARNFHRLLRAAGSGFDTYMFADQDDVWLPAKIARAWTYSHGRRSAVLYLTAFNYVDCNRVFLRRSRPPRVVGPKNAVVQSLGPGCAMAVNAMARNILLGFNIPPGVMHDRWFYFVISLYGEVVYDNEVNLMYRLHGNNTVGAPTGAINHLSKKVSRYFTGGSGGLYAAASLAQCALKQLESPAMESLRPALTTLAIPPQRFISRAIAFLRLPFVRQSRLETQVMKLALLFKRP